MVLIPATATTGPLLATGSRDGTVRIWDPRADTALLTSLRGAHAPTQLIFVSPVLCGGGPAGLSLLRLDLDTA